MDSTNIITPLLSVITNIGWDHANLLGDTLEKIATEKAGIIKKNIPVVVGETKPETKNIFIAKAKKKMQKLFLLIKIIKLFWKKICRWRIIRSWLTFSEEKICITKSSLISQDIIN